VGKDDRAAQHRHRARRPHEATAELKTVPESLYREAEVFFG
jgi:hypothetical protein